MAFDEPTSHLLYMKKSRIITCISYVFANTVKCVHLIYYTHIQEKIQNSTSVYRFICLKFPIKETERMQSNIKAVEFKWYFFQIFCTFTVKGGDKKDNI